MGGKRNREGEWVGRNSPLFTEPLCNSSSEPFDLIKKNPEIYIPDRWSEAAQTIALNVVLPVVFVCGPKNSGKTMFSRFLVNILLQRYKNVGYLDTDVGQSEFTPPGCLSLHVLQEQTTDFKVMSLKTPVKCIFFGDISSKRDPKAYLNGVFSLYDHFLMEYCSSSDLEYSRKPLLPLVINTPGWVKGAGYEILVEMLGHITTTHVVQLCLSAQRKNLPRGHFWLDGNQMSEVDVIELNAARKDSLDKSLLIEKQTHDLRDIRIIAYFSQCFPHDIDSSTFENFAYALASIPPYEVSISEVKTVHLHCQVPCSEILYSLNATIVGLSVSTETTGNGIPWCVGLGIVRSIDISKDLLYIITPVNPKILEKVDLLLQGFIEIPSRLLQIHEYMPPYMSANVLNKLDPSI
ncbi:Polynucleotide 5'-hydroxyl-kinase grc3 [Zostera marina]|uniref:Polynucleotide 5'-hydroxyl-kinase grc3 n=1 Tax=Zostera marina TaxID=29655 RepID=A0A0K9PNB0_ZOSMR|nr:Polynucleotide 5'-hydroxyl-kinase grc3 [Zostera marina]